MAYMNYLASIPEAGLLAKQADRDVCLRPSNETAVSHLLAYWIEEQPLGSLLGQALDGGEVLNASMKHQLRVPVFHRADEVKSLLQKLRQAFESLVTDDDWLKGEMARLLRLFQHASDHDECVLSCLDKPREI